MEHVVYYSTLHAKAEQAEQGRQKEKEAREHGKQVVREVIKRAEILEKKLTELQEKQKERANYEAHHRRKFIGASEISPLSRHLHLQHGSYFRLVMYPCFFGPATVLAI